MTDILDNITKVQGRIQQAAHKSGRQATDITLLAVSKTQPADAIEHAFLVSGLRHFGENYVQEAAEKQQTLLHLPLIWHFIGSLQSNKTTFIAEHFHWCHSIDRLKIAERLHHQRPDTLPPLNICIQVNIDHEASKTGLAMSDVENLITSLLPLDRLSIRGLMVIPTPDQPDGDTLASFQRAADGLAALRKRFPQLPLDTLSMGMSADLELAIAAGSTVVRVGTDIFGARKSSVDQ